MFDSQKLQVRGYSSVFGSMFSDICGGVPVVMIVRDEATLCTLWEDVFTVADNDQVLHALSCIESVMNGGQMAPPTDLVGRHKGCRYYKNHLCDVYPVGQNK